MSNTAVDSISATQIWFELLSNERYFKNCKKFNAYALKFLNRSFNEGIVEVEVSSLNKISSESRPLQQQTTDKLNFISTNGPHPLVSSGLVENFWMHILGGIGISL